MSSHPEPGAGADIVARNFIKQHGKARLRKFLRMLKAGDSGERIAEEFGVSRERVRQWKNTFGAVVKTYDLKPEIAKLAGIR